MSAVGFMKGVFGHGLIDSGLGIKVYAQFTSGNN